MFRFPWGDMHSLNLGWFLQKFNELRADWATAEENIAGALDAEIEKAEDALSDVFAARDAAAASATAAAGSASAAGTSATAAQNSATGAASSATLANQKATAAGLSEAAAAQSATQAGNSATAAAGSATQAGQSATNAAASETAAGQSASAAAGSATAAGNSATAAGNSATAAAASAARAEEVEERIPEDYSALSADVETLKEEIAALPYDFTSYIYSKYFQMPGEQSVFIHGTLSALREVNVFTIPVNTDTDDTYSTTRLLGINSTTFMTSFSPSPSTEGIWIPIDIFRNKTLSIFCEYTNIYGNVGARQTPRIGIWYKYNDDSVSQEPYAPFTPEASGKVSVPIIPPENATAILFGLNLRVKSAAGGVYRFGFENYIP